MSWFNAADHKPELTLPGALVGKYPLRVTKTEQRVNQNADGASLILSYVVIDGPMVNQIGALNINIWNKDETAKRIAGQQLSAICHVTGVPVLAAKPDGVELVGKDFIVEVALQPEPNPKKYTNLVGVWDMQGNLPKPGIFGAPQAQPGPQFQQPQPAPQGYPQPQPAFQPAPSPQPQPNFGGAAPQAPWAQNPGAAKPAWER